LPAAGSSRDLSAHLANELLGALVFADGLADRADIGFDIGNTLETVQLDISNARLLDQELEIYLCVARG
jgi:hypothetical protein